MVTAFVTVITVALIMFIGLVFDGGNILAARREAIDEAEGAARAAAQDVNTASRRTGQVTLDPVEVDAAVAGYLAPTGHRGSAVTDGREVTVTVSFAQPLWILGIGGMVSRTVSGRGTARPLPGITNTEAP
jgi:Flp pilus assembly protein TadG